MKVLKCIKIKKGENGNYFLPIPVGKGPLAGIINIDFDPNVGEVIEKSKSVPINIGEYMYKNSWVYKNYYLEIESQNNESEEDVLMIKHFILKKEKALEKISKEVEAFENFDKTQNAKRERIPDDVRLFVWQRDEGKCVKCASNQKLEFDHIIPVIEGGSNTDRNIQLLCENCNRSKGRKI